jgi:hypothetical protein
MRFLRTPAARRDSIWRTLASPVLGALVVILALLGSVPGITAGPLFGARAFETGYAPLSIVVADFDGDGIQDLVTANSGENSVSILLGLGNANFALPVHYAVGQFPQSVAVGDLNGDGRPDLISANNGSNSISVLLGTGGGSFGAKADFDTRFRPYSVAVADLNRDGKLDVVTANSTVFVDYNTGVQTDSNRVSVFLGDGAGRFASRSDVVTLSRPRALALGDLDSDGNLDVGVASSVPYGGSVSVLLGNGDGSLRSEERLYMAGRGAASVAIGDLNGDGRPDMVSANSEANNVSVFLGNGDGTLAACTYYGTGLGPSSTAIVDLNGDSRADFAAVNLSSNTVSVFLGRGDGSFADKVDYGPGYSPSAVAVADLNADGAWDLAVACYHTVTVLLGNGAGGYLDKTDYPTGQWPNWVAIGDVNGDHKADLVTGSCKTVSVSSGNGDGKFPAPTDCGAWAYPGVYEVAVSDLNGDGPAEIVATNASSTVSVLIGNGDGSWSRTEYPTPANVYALAIGDLNGDSKPDVVAANGSTACVWLGVGDGSLGVRKEHPLGGSAGQVALGDLNGDGDLDLATTNFASPVGHVTVFLGNGDGTFGTGVGFPTGSRPRSVTAADVNRDGKLDLITGNESGTASVLLGTGDGRFPVPVDYVIGGSPEMVRCGDVNADGDLDLVAANFNTHTVQVLLGSGDGSFGPRMDFAAGGWPTCVAVGDLNGDGRVDLAVTNQHISTVSVLLNRGDQPVPALAALLSAAAEPGRVELKWYVGLEASSWATVHRRTRGSDWRALGPATPDGTGAMGFVDTSVSAGEEYGYCLGIPSGGEVVLTGEVWVTVPAGYSLALEGARPNPAVSGLRVSFTLPDGGPAELALFDVAGRQVLSWRLLGLGPGRHVLALDGGQHLAPGVYTVRLSHGGRFLTARAVVIH